MAKRGVVRLDDSRFPNGDIFSVRIDTEMENGFVVKLGELEKDNLDVRKAVTPSAGDSVVLIANGTRFYNNDTLGNTLETKYFMDAGEVVRAYGLHPNYVFSISEECVEGSAVEDQYLITGTGNKLVPSADIPLDAKGFVGKVIEKEQVGGALSLNVDRSPVVYVVVEVIQNPY